MKVDTTLDYLTPMEYMKYIVKAQQQAKVLLLMCPAETINCKLVSSIILYTCNNINYYL